MCQLQSVRNRAFDIKRQQFLFFLPSVCLYISPTTTISRLVSSQAQEEILADTFPAIQQLHHFFYSSPSTVPVTETITAQAVPPGPLAGAGRLHSRDH